MINFDTELGRRGLARLRDEDVIWLTTVDKIGRPQPRPVWFHWDGENLLIFSEPEAAKVRHIRRNPNIALHFNSDETGGDVVVLLGHAALDEALPKERLRAYELKYRAGIQELGMTFNQMMKDYRTAIVVTPTLLRGFA